MDTHCLAREYEELPEVSETIVTLAMIQRMLHWLAKPNHKPLPTPRLLKRSQRGGR